MSTCGLPASSAEQRGHGLPEQSVAISAACTNLPCTSRGQGCAGSNATMYSAPPEDENTLALTLPSKGDKGKACGEVYVKSFSAEIRPTFLDYLQSGAEISFVVAIVGPAGMRTTCTPRLSLFPAFRCWLCTGGYRTRRHTRCQEQLLSPALHHRPHYHCHPFPQHHSYEVMPEPKPEPGGRQLELVQ